MPINNSRQMQKFNPHRRYHLEAASYRSIAIQSRYFRIMAAYAAVTAACLLFCAIYEIFSFGEQSLFMRMTFIIPLLGGAVPFGLMAVSENPPSISRGAFNLWNSGLAVHGSGCLVRGIIEISGRVPDYDNYYWIISGLFLTLAFINQIVAWRRSKSVK